MRVSGIRPGFLKIVVGIIVCVVLSVAAWHAPGPIDGAYMDSSACGCDSHNFYYLSKGKAVCYWGNHPPPLAMGTISHTSDGWRWHLPDKKQTVLRVEPHLLYLRQYEPGSLQGSFIIMREFRFWQTSKVLSDPAQKLSCEAGDQIQSSN